MFEKIIPVIIALIALQFFIRYMNNKRKKNPEISPDRLNYKKRIDDIMRISNYDDGVNSGQKLADEAKNSLGRPELILSIPDNMREVRKELNRIIDAVTQGVRAKTGSLPDSESGYKNPSAMFDEILEVVNRHKQIRD